MALLYEAAQMLVVGKAGLVPTKEPSRQVPSSSSALVAVVPRPVRTAALKKTSAHLWPSSVPTSALGIARIGMQLWWLCPRW